MADLRERGPDLLEIMQSLIDANLAAVMTSIPVKVVKDSDGHTVSLQPLIKSVFRQPDGSDKLVEFPVIQDAPVKFASGGGHTFTHPVKENDEGMALVSMRSMDNWHQQGGVQQPNDARMHDLSDSIYIPGVRSDKRKLEKVSTTSAQFRTDDGDSVVDVSGKGVVTSRKNSVVTVDDTGIETKRNSSAVKVTDSSVKTKASKVLLNCNDL